MENPENRKTQVSRRQILQLGTGTGIVFGMGGLLYSASTTALKASQSEEGYAVSFSEEEWRRKLSPERYSVLREEATERSYSSDLLKEKREGTYHCAGCDLASYSSKTKYESGTGWPSFWDALPNAIGTREDKSFFMTRTEIHCRRCGGHFGHVFNDGPQPTGKRHCLNGLALVFKVADG